MITSMRGCVAYNDLWPWPISSRSFGLDLENHVLSVASTVLDGFFPYLVQMITSMRGCVAYNDLWPWPISSRSFGLDLENRVLSVASTVLDGFFPYLVQMITSMRRCVACDDLWPWPISSRSFGLDLENRVLCWGLTMITGFPRTRWPWRQFSESYVVRISVKISQICEFRVIMRIMTGLLGCCSMLRFWSHHSSCSLGSWTNNTLAARSLSPNQHESKSIVFVHMSHENETFFVFRQ